MAFSSGVFSRLYNWVTDRNAGTKILAARMDAEMDGFATGLSSCILKDGTQTITANIPFNGFKVTGLGDATTSGDAVHLGQLQSGYQPLDADLTAIAALTSAANKVPYSTGAGAWALADFSAAGRALAADADAAAQRTTLGLGSVALLNSVALTNTSGVATNKLIGRSTAGTGAAEEITIGAGLSISGGTISADAWNLIDTQSSSSGTTVAFTSIDSRYNELMIFGDGVSMVSGPSNVNVDYSTDNGGAYTTIANIQDFTSAASTYFFAALLENIKTKLVYCRFQNAFAASGANSAAVATRQIVNNTTPIDAIRVVGSASFDAGTIYLYGR